MTSPYLPLQNLQVITVTRGGFNLRMIFAKSGPNQEWSQNRLTEPYSMIKA